jgi:hypothetical protein
MEHLTFPLVSRTGDEEKEKENGPEEDFRAVADAPISRRRSREGRRQSAGGKARFRRKITGTAPQMHDRLNAWRTDRN